MECIALKVNFARTPGKMAAVTIVAVTAAVAVAIVAAGLSVLAAFFEEMDEERDGHHKDE